MAHREHRAGPHAGLVGPFVVSAALLPTLAALLADDAAGSFPVAVTVPEPDQVTSALAAAASIPAVRLTALEVAVPDDVPAERVVPALATAVRHHSDIHIFVELPRDERRPALSARCPAPVAAKLRTGGVRAALYPGRAGARRRRRLPRRRRRALQGDRRTAPRAAQHRPRHRFRAARVPQPARRDGRRPRRRRRDEVADVLADRDAAVWPSGCVPCPPGAPYDGFRSFGTCSITEPGRS